MKKSKKLLIAAAGMMAAGILLLVIAYPLGGRFFYSIGPDGIRTAQSLNGQKSNYQIYTLEKTALPDISRVEIETNFADISVEAADGFYLEYCIGSNTKEPQYVVKDGCFSFLPNSNVRDFQFINVGPIPFTGSNLSVQDNKSSNERLYIKLYVPSDAVFSTLSLHTDSGSVSWPVKASADSITMNSDFGDVSLDNVTADRGEITSSSGDIIVRDTALQQAELYTGFGSITAERLSGKTLTLSADSGSVSIKDSEGDQAALSSEFGEVYGEDIRFRTLDLHNESGDIVLEKADFTSLTADNDFGLTSIDAVHPESFYSYELSTDFGSISINGNTYGNQMTRNEGAAPYISVENASGDISITTE